MWKVIAFVSCLCLLAASASSALGANDVSQKIDDVMKEWVDPDTPGAAVAALGDGKVIFRKCYGLANLETKSLITENSVFNLGSLAKPFTAYGMAMLTVQGKVTPSDSIRKHLPELPELMQPITIQHLVNQTSGIRDYAGLLRIGGYKYEDFIDQAHVMKLITAQKKLSFTPGTQWAYSNSNYVLLAEVISRVTGEPYPKWVQKNLLEPLGMKSSQALGNPFAVITNLAVSYEYDWDNKVFNRCVSQDAVVGDGNMYSTLDDMIRWVGNLERGIVGGAPVRDLALTRGVLSSGEATDYAWGLFVREVDGEQIIDHSGKTAGYLSYVALHPKKRLSVIVLSNVSYFDPTGVARRLIEIFSGGSVAEPAATEAEVKATPDRAHITLPEDTLSRYAGKYRARMGGRIWEIVRADKKLFLKGFSSDGSPIEMKPVSEDTFDLGDMNAALTVAWKDARKPEKVEITYRSRTLAADFVEELTLSAERADAFAGIYHSDEVGAVYRLTSEEGRLVARHGRLADTVLTTFDGVRFSGSQPWLRNLTFRLDKAGKPVGFDVTTVGVTDLFFEKLR